MPGKPGPTKTVRRNERVDTKPAREYAGVLIASIVVISYIAIGFSAMFSQIVFGVEVKQPEDWRSAMLSLASAALGYLIGKQVTARHDDDEGYSAKEYEAALYRTPPSAPCPTCGHATDADATAVASASRLDPFQPSDRDPNTATP